MTTAIRIGDAEREAAISSLTSHFAEGRLTQVEHDERMTLALHAKTGRDLDVLFADLPRRGDATPATRRPARGLSMQRLLQPLFAALFIGVLIFVILNLLPTIAIVARDPREPAAVRISPPPLVRVARVVRPAASLVGQARVSFSTGIVRMPAFFRSYSPNPG